MRTKRKSGFTLVELMIVAAIIAILAAILIPLLASNRDSAIAAEASNICSLAATEAKVYWTKNSEWPDVSDLPQQTQDEMDRAKYFDVDDVTIGGSGPSAYTITVTGGADDYSTEVDETLTLDEEGTWGGSVVANGWIGN
jgi:prepilin-type N-terminal cleavage/methylation domain-containing protein